MEEKMTLLDAEIGKTYTVKEINTDDDDMNSFLFRLGCYTGEPITLISKKKKSCIVAIKDGRYNLDNLLSEAIIIRSSELIAAGQDTEWKFRRKML